MTDVLAWLKSPRNQAHIHLALVGAWMVLLIPSLTIWRGSIVWLVLMSWYAIFVGHLAAFQGARGEQRQEESS